MKTLIVRYTPRMERSNTGKLVDFFQTLINGEIEIEDVAHGHPPMFNSTSLSAYYKKYYNGEKLNPHESQALEKFERLTVQVKTADMVVVAYPMYNFSLPAAVKAYFDAIIFHGETWKFNKGSYEGLMKGKKALVITTSGGVYGKGTPAESFNHSDTLAAGLLQFMGFETEVVKVEGINANPNGVDEALKNAKDKLQDIAKKWYSH